jgi:short-subunit dehydrogenase
MDVAGRTVLLTGASGGLGAAIAEALAARGARLLLSGRRGEQLEPLATRTRGEVLVCDLAARGEPERLAAEAGEVDVLVANAGLPGSGQLEDYDVAGIDRVLEVNLRAPIVLARLLVPGMVSRGSGHVVFMSSLAGRAATVGQSLYVATKFGLRGFASGLRADLAGSGVGVSAIFPGFIRDAGMFHEAGVKLPRGVGTKTPEDVARAVLRAIERDKAQLDVAPLGLRAGALIAEVAPETAARITRRLGGDGIASDFARGQAGTT